MKRAAGNVLRTTAIIVVASVLVTGAAAGGERSAKVTVMRVPGGGIQPQAAVDGKGVLHLVYFKGRPAAGDLFYVRSEDGTRFSDPIRINSRPGSAIAIGNIRGAHLAVGKNGRVHVAWNGSSKAAPTGPHNSTPMLYTRLNDAGTAFERERNVIQSAVGLDGGGSVAADDAGNVYVTWHAPEPGARGEEKRRVWVARSTDDGKTFGRERPAFAEPTGACGCCGMRAFADRQGTVYLLYRSATEEVHRDMYLLMSKAKAAGFKGRKLHAWRTGACPMSSASFSEGSAGVLASWETAGQVYYVRIHPATGRCSAPVAAPGESRERKHPAVAANARGKVLLAWTEGMGWDRGGALAWQVFDRTGKPTTEKGRTDGVPTWSLVAVFVRPDGGFAIVY